MGKDAHKTKTRRLRNLEIRRANHAGEEENEVQKDEQKIGKRTDDGENGEEKASHSVQISRLETGGGTCRSGTCSFSLVTRGVSLVKGGGEEGERWGGEETGVLISSTEPSMWSCNMGNPPIPTM
ncbi:Hypothetical protein NTJ_07299 [Nesidiocoris tenuis]|uniref:Uncharacterized protein n=1 Tax=Nesidiocoris tenuis TaxID=355587 RepID=A0ABN7AQL4_9HEMI|nr:Hypothetical protein NTJ_07299 [Nesidiocoris tenuis]